VRTNEYGETTWLVLRHFFVVAGSETTVGGFAGDKTCMDYATGLGGSISIKQRRSIDAQVTPSAGSRSCSRSSVVNRRHKQLLHSFISASKDDEPCTY